METLTVKKVNEVYMTIDCDGGSCWELQDYFTFTVPGRSEEHTSELQSQD